MQELALQMVIRRVGDAHLLMRGQDRAPCKFRLQPISTGLQETPYCLIQGRFWTKGCGSVETPFTPEQWFVLYSELVLAESTLWKSTFQWKHL